MLYTHTFALPGSTSRTADNFVRDLCYFGVSWACLKNPINLGFMHNVQDLGFEVSKKVKTALVHKVSSQIYMYRFVCDHNL